MKLTSPNLKEYRHVTKKPNASSSGNKKKGVEPTIEVSNSNPFDVLNLVDNDMEFGTNEGLLICEVKVVFDETANLRIPTSGKDGSDKGYGTNSLLEQWRDSYPDNDDYDPYDDEMYENHDLSEHLQSICDDLDITVRYTVESDENRMEHDIELTNPVSQTPYDLPLSGGHTPGSDEGSMTLKELMDLCTTLLQKVLDLENVTKGDCQAGTSKRYNLGRRKVSKQGRNNLKSQQMFQDIDDVLDEDADTQMIVEDKGNGKKGGSIAKTVSTARSDISASRLEVSLKADSTIRVNQ
nr:hypothetical protein [Tanacetum cinerariifolium]